MKFRKNQPVALNKLVTADKQQIIIKAIKQLGDVSLKTLKNKLGQAIATMKLS